MTGFAHFCKISVLGKQAIARMNCVHVCNFSGADYSRNVEITLCKLRGTDADGFVSKTYVQRIAIGVTVDCNRTDAELLAGADDP